MPRISATSSALRSFDRPSIAALEKNFEAGATVTVEALVEKGLVKKVLDGVKVLGIGDITKALTVQANAFSESAKAKIEAAGG